MRKIAKICQKGAKIGQIFAFLLQKKSQKRCYMDLLKLIHGFVKFYIWLKLFDIFFVLCQTKNRLKFDQDFKAC